MAFIEDHSTLFPSLKCDSHPSGPSTSMDFSPKSFGSSIILGNECFPMDYFNEVTTSISISFTNSLDIDDVAYLLIFKQLEDGNHMHMGKSITIDINDDPIYPKIFYLGDVLYAKE